MENKLIDLVKNQNKIYFLRSLVKIVHFATSFVPNTDRKPYVRITMASYFSKTSASLMPSGHTISINLGDFVLQQTSLS